MSDSSRPPEASCLALGMIGLGMIGLGLMGSGARRGGAGLQRLAGLRRFGDLGSGFRGGRSHLCSGGLDALLSEVNDVRGHLL